MSTEGWVLVSGLLVGIVGFCLSYPGPAAVPVMRGTPKEHLRAMTPRPMVALGRRTQFNGRRPLTTAQVHRR